MRAAVQLLGRFDLRVGAGQSVKVPAGKVCALFAALALAPNHRQSREISLTLLWGDYPEQQARGSLRFALTVLRKALARSECLSLRASKDAVWLEAPDIQVDALEFEALAKTNNPADLQKAIDLYGGDFLEGLTVRCEQFEEWVRAHRTRLRGLLESALAKLLTHAQASEKDELSIEIAHKLLTLDPLQEGIHRILIGIHLRHGRKGAALKQYERCADFLRNELNTRPDVETSRLVAGLRPGPPVITQATALRTVRAPCEILVQSFRTEEGGKPDTELAIRLDESIRFALARLSEFKLVIPPDGWRKSGRNADDDWTPGAGFVVNGVVKMRAGRVEATICLAEMPSSSHFWTRQFLLAPSDLEELDAFAARKIVPSIHYALQQKQLELLRRVSATELNGIQLGLLARAELEKLSRPSLSAAVGLARRARQNGTVSSLACNMLALARVFQVRMGWADNCRAALAEALEATEEALSLEFNDPVAHGVLGLIHLWSGSHTRALNSVNRAITLSPNRADVVHWKGLVLDFTGKHEQAIDHHLAALDLDPLHGAAFATINALSGAYYELGAYEQAAGWARRSIKVNPSYRRGHAVLAASLAQMGDEPGCALALKSAWSLDPSLSLKMQLSAFPYKNTSEIIAWERGFRKAGLR
jgi:DNA-binding SARP family transcriptional activator/tetratricopeptide (TPR) repeat protein